MKKTIRFIINPISGVGQKNKLPDMIQKYLEQDQFDYEIVFTEHRGHGKQLAHEAVDQSIDIVCAVGGDGSVNEVGSVLAHTSTILAILPTGSGNGLARHLGLHLKVKKAIKNINRFNHQSIDTVSIDNKTFLNVAGFGFDALVANRFDQYHSRGFLSYAKLVFHAFKSYKGINITINDEHTFNGLLFCSFANGSQFGNGFMISPQSNIEDGQVEIVCIELPHLFGLLILIIRSFFGTIHKSSRYHMMSVSQATISSSTQIAHLDGEPITIDKSAITIKCHSAPLKVII